MEVEGERAERSKVYEVKRNPSRTRNALKTPAQPGVDNAKKQIDGGWHIFSDKVFGQPGQSPNG